MLSRKATIINLIADTEINFITYEHSARKINVGLHLTNYLTEADLKGATGIHTSN